MTRRTRRFGWAGAAAVLVAAGLANQSAVHWRDSRDDSDLFVYYGWCAAQGARPYLDFWDNKPPGIFWVNAAAVSLVGVDKSAELLVGAAALALLAGAVLGIARTIYSRGLLLPAAIVLGVAWLLVPFECGADRTETLVAACETWGILAYLRWRRRGRMPWLVLCGLALGLAPLFKQSGIAAPGACLLHAAYLAVNPGCHALSRCGPVPRWWQRSSAMPVALAAFAAPSASAALALAVHGAVPEAIRAVFTFNRAYFAVGDATWVHVDRAARVAWPAWQPVWPLVLLMLCGLACLAAVRTVRVLSHPRQGLSPPRRGPGLIALWVLLATYLALAGPGRLAYHFQPALPGLVLLALLPLHLLAGRHTLWRRAAATPLIAVIVVVWLYAALMPMPSALAALRHCWQQKRTWYARDEASGSPDLARGILLRQLAREDERVYVFGWSPGTYRHAQRLPASRFATFEKLGQVHEHAQFIFDGALADIRRVEPAAIAVAENDYPRLLAEGPPDFVAWLVERYEIVATLDRMHVLRRVDHSRGD